MFNCDLQRNLIEYHCKHLQIKNENQHCFGWPEGLESLVRNAKKLWEEFVFEILLGIDFPRQPNTGLGATKKRFPEKAGTIVRASSSM